MQQTCGNCHFGRPVQDVTKVLCGGLPVQILRMVIPTPRGIQVQEEGVRPVVNKTEPACALWKFKMELPDGLGTEPTAPASRVRYSDLKGSDDGGSGEVSG
jgi:hypothetical protein